MKQLRKDNPEGWAKAAKAVKATQGEIITFRDEPIQALYFSASNGFTENSEDVFPRKASLFALRFQPVGQRGLSEIRRDGRDAIVRILRRARLNRIRRDIPFLQEAFDKGARMVEGHRVKQLVAGSVTMSGEDVRRKLGLRSAAFDWKISGSKISITTYGSGHGVGMSQWGAEGMAGRENGEPNRGTLLFGNAHRGSFEACDGSSKTVKRECCI